MKDVDLLFIILEFEKLNGYVESIINKVFNRYLTFTLITILVTLVYFNILYNMNFD